MSHLFDFYFQNIFFYMCRDFKRSLDDRTVMSMFLIITKIMSHVFSIISRITSMTSTSNHLSLTTQNIYIMSGTVVFHRPQPILNATHEFPK